MVAGQPAAGLRKHPPRQPADRPVALFARREEGLPAGRRPQQQFPARLQPRRQIPLLPQLARFPPDLQRLRVQLPLYRRHPGLRGGPRSRHPAAPAAAERRGAGRRRPRTGKTGKDGEGRGGRQGGCQKDRAGQKGGPPTTSPTSARAPFHCPASPPATWPTCRPAKARSTTSASTATTARRPPSSVTTSLTRKADTAIAGVHEYRTLGRRPQGALQQRRQLFPGQCRGRHHPGQGKLDLQGLKMKLDPRQGMGADLRRGLAGHPRLVLRPQHARHGLEGDRRALPRPAALGLAACRRRLPARRDDRRAGRRPHLRAAGRAGGQGAAGGRRHAGRRVGGRPRRPATTGSPGSWPAKAGTTISARRCSIRA